MQYWVGYFLEDFYPFRKGDGVNISSIETGIEIDENKLHITGFINEVNIDFQIPKQYIIFKEEKGYYVR